ncbi:hypothetical protein D3C81_1300700 [compost metagenome]
MNIAPAQRAGAELVISRQLRALAGGDQATLKVRVILHVDLIAIGPREDAGLLLHRGVIGIDLRLPVIA